MLFARPGRIRCSFEPKCMSLAASTTPPFSIAARSTTRPRSRAGSTSTSPRTRSRATPPSGKMLRRTWVKGPALVTANRLLEPGARGEGGSTSVQRRPLQPRARGISRQVAGLERGPLRLVADEEARVDVDRADPAAQAEREHAPVVPRSPPPPRLPAVHPLAAARVLAGDEDGRLRLDEAASRREELVVGVERAPAHARGDEVGKLGVVHRRPVHSEAESSAPRGEPSKPPAENTRRPRSQVCRTTPWSRRPR